ncbi:L-aspartate oxidase [Polystyrenella longa]|uniref:L-aspartate oxidase n=1 Tax=Polystyrenella longa TaxID=2528007 RepID=A0A518CRY1_9PLAN|nr:L-aspartate oxidase [Polystyrenella longa]QDU81973.1 L-aspartate oxidase [Polystyrenella longa]
MVFPPLQFTPHRRYLTRFDPKRVPHMFTDVLIVGGGIAGIRAALEIDPKLQTVVVTKDSLGLSNSVYAQGGIAGVLDPLDNVANHISDTISAGKGLCDDEIVKMVVEEAPVRIRELATLGTHFDTTTTGEIALTQEGGHSHARVAHALGDATGKEIMRAMHVQVRNREEQKHLQVWEETYTIDLLTHEGVCRGAIVWNPNHGKTFVWAKQTIIATGGAGQLYRETTNPSIATGDGHAIAFRAGAEMRDMEMMQFHPTVLYIAGGSRHLISEAVRGEGAYLVDCNGYRFMQDYDPQMELAPRDIVSRSITAQMEKTNHPCTYLDLTHLPAKLIDERFPHIGQVCREFGIDIHHDRVPVRPGAHYMIGGVVVDSLGQTTLPGLWAAGEVTSSGLHGANRLGSNSLLEGLVFGLRAGRGASDAALDQRDSFTAPGVLSEWSDVVPHEDNLNLMDVQNALTSLMWRKAGIKRDDPGLKEAINQLAFWDRYVSLREFSTPTGWELQNLLHVAQLLTISARTREESRGVHFRSDHPETNPEMKNHIRMTASY